VGCIDFGLARRSSRDERNLYDDEKRKARFF
jgi:hypothetical protein